jgi:hypothetical protein
MLPEKKSVVKKSPFAPHEANSIAFTSTDKPGNPPSRHITPFAMLSIMRQQELSDRMPHDRVAEVAEFVESRTASMVATESIFPGHSAITQINTGENRMLTSMLTSRLPRSDHLTQ